MQNGEQEKGSYLTQSRKGVMTHFLSFVIMIWPWSQRHWDYDPSPNLKKKNVFLIEG